jgi:hypothetical protein
MFVRETPEALRGACFRAACMFVRGLLQSGVYVCEGAPEAFFYLCR